MKTKGELKNAEDSSNQEFLTGVAFGHCKTWIEAYANSSGEITERVLTQRVAALLLASSGGEVLGSEKSVPDVRRKAAKHSRNATRLSQKNLAHGAHHKTSKLKQKMYSRMEHRIRVAKNPKLRIEAIEWFKKNYPNSKVIKTSSKKTA